MEELILSEFARRSGEINDLLCVLNLLNWDARTQMPSEGVSTRAQQVATITALAQEKLLDARFEAAAYEVLRSQVTGSERIAATQALTALEVLQRVPKRLTRKLAECKGRAQEVWTQARQRNDFGLFLPYLKEMVALNRELAEAIGYHEHPYDALLGLYEPGLTSRQLSALFTELRQHHLPLLKAIQAQPVPRHDFLLRHYPASQQREISLKWAKAFGYDLTRGRLNASAHPFEISFTR